MTQTVEGVKLNLTWRRYAVGMAVCATPIVALTGLGLASGAADIPVWGPLLIFLSVVAFLTYRWHQLQKEALASGQALESAVVPDVQKALIGPTLPAVAWFFVTCGGIIALVVISALLSRAQ